MLSNIGILFTLKHAVCYNSFLNPKFFPVGISNILHNNKGSLLPGENIIWNFPDTEEDAFVLALTIYNSYTLVQEGVVNIMKVFKQPLIGEYVCELSIFCANVA